MTDKTASGPAALNNSSPILATPNQGRSSFARRVAATTSSTSRASANRSRMGWTVSVAMGSPLGQVGQAFHVMQAAPFAQLCQDSGRRPRVGERRGADLHRVGASDQELGRVL